MPRKIYACDVLYGKGINFYTYKGYEVWGKWFAKKLKNNKMVFKIFHPVFVRWANQMAFEVSGGKYGKNNTFIKILKRTGETISNIIGRIAERRKKMEHPIEIGNMERNEELFMEKMGFPRDAEG